MIRSIFYYKNAGFWRYLNGKRLANLKLRTRMNMDDKKVCARIYLRISYETTILAVFQGRSQYEVKFTKCCRFFFHQTDNIMWTQKNRLAFKNTYMLFTGLGRSVLGKTVPSVSSTENCPNTDRPWPVNNIFIYFKILFLEGRRKY